MTWTRDRGLAIGHEYPKPDERIGFVLAALRPHEQAFGLGGAGAT